MKNHIRRQVAPLSRPRQIGTTRDGRPVWSIAGGAVDDPAPDDDDPDDDDDGFDADRARDKIRKANNEAKNLRRRVKELEASEQKLKDLEDSEKSEFDKLNSKLTDAEKRAEQAETRALRLEVAHAKGLTPAQAKRLTGSSLEELEEDADELLELFGTSSNGADDDTSQEDDDEPQEGGTPAMPGKPKERLPDGKPSTPETKSPEDLADAVMKRQRGY